MALLEMVNSVRGKLREERVGAISATDLLTTEIIDLINDAGSEILEGNDWEFDVRHDGRLWYPAPQEGTAATFGSTSTISNTTSVTLFYASDNATGEVFADAAAIDLAGFRCSGNSMRSRIMFPDSPLGNTSWIIGSVQHNTASFTVVASSNFQMTLSSAPTWKTYSNELVLPTTVKDVLSVRNEEEPIRLSFINRDMQFDQWVPRATDSFSSVPELVVVGGTITSTTRTSNDGTGLGEVLAPWTTIANEPAVTGPCCMVWPIPSSDLHLEYSYRVQHADLSAATDAWAGVPQNIIHIIEWRAFQGALDSGIQNDPQQAARAERQVEKRLARALAKQSRQPNRRLIPAAFGSRRSGSSRGRWASQSISAPS